MAKKKKLFNNQNVSLSFLDGLVYDAARYEPFNDVYANFVLHWVPEDDIQPSLRCIYECLKPGGRLAAHMTANTLEALMLISLPWRPEHC